MTGHLEEARGWLLDCFSDPVDQEQIETLGATELLLAVDRYYPGGWAAFEREAV